MRHAVIAALVLLLGTACGGSGGGDDSISVTYNPASPRICAELGWTSVATLHATATLSRVPSDVALVRINLTPGILDPASINIIRQGGNVFAVTAPVLAGLAAGAHQGTVSFDLCKDSQCSSKYALSGAVLPYTVQVDTPATLSVTANGVPLTGSGTWGNWFTIHSGDTVVVTSSAPVTWGTGISLVRLTSA